MAKNPSDPNNRVPATQGVPPIVFMFRPTKYFKVPPQELEEWERHLFERVTRTDKGNAAPRLVPQMRPVGIGSYCGCPEFDDCDDV
jgi:hypothetical protein